ncbi:DEAD/DEAH box helicase family protein [Lignipirellula cremea]|uniref:Type I restriction enzyme EcoKI subunit R n=1 Tax=Lignipirellula cremea TaxID=2528010 RepID=A0A518E3B2_9BACT|nr:DEAD/DEAH box helicase family protein [Lignipirellula cremea]QDU98579.1 type I restriction enzyme EcoKI subunit R [Lignipirellula cremea]
MTSNFDFLQPAWIAFLEDAVQTERNALRAPRTCAFYARRTLELAVKWMFAHDSYLKTPYKENLAALIHEQTFKDTLPPGLFQQVRMIQKLGNLAVHSDTNINPQDGLQVTRCLHATLGWIAKAYGQGAAPLPFNPDLLPRPEEQAAPGTDQTAEQLTTLQGELAAKDAAYLDSLDKLAATEEQVQKLLEQIQQIKAENAKTIADEDYSEESTRDLFIDLMLREAGWDPHGPNVSEYEVAGMPNKSGVGFVDYVLWGDDGLPLAVVEAKKTKVNPRAGERQAELYADCLEQKFGQRPIIFYSSGYQTWLWDDTRYPPREVQGFYAKDELQRLIHRRTSRGDITTTPSDKSVIDRYYQEEAVRRILHNFGEELSRKSLVVMATGSGKTRLSIAAVDILMRQDWVLRTLFLADRNALLTQAKRNFTKLLPHASVVNLGESPENEKSRIVFSTYPTMLNCIDDARKDGQKRFGVGHFDLIIIDEAHRSVYQKFGAIFDYFDSLLLGLTATPKAEVDRNTYGLFELQDHVPTYAYELNDAVNDEYLVPPKAISVPLKFQREGIKYAELTDAEKAEYEEEFFDDETASLPRQIDAGALNNWLFNADTVNKVLKHLMEHGLKVEGGDRLGKTIIFAKNHNHAQFIVDQFDLNYPKLAGKFCRLIDNQVKDAQGLIDNFSVTGKQPQIAVSVDMLDTGIDVPEVVNLVFFKLVRSKTKFWQMIGRGTRLCPDLFGPSQDKEFFYVFDYCENFEFFGAHPDGVEAAIQESVKTKNFKRRVLLVDHLQGSQPDGQAELDDLANDYRDQLQGVVAKMDVNNFIVRAKRAYVEKYRERASWDVLSQTDMIDVQENLASLPYDDEDDEFARRFDLLVLSLELAILEHDPKLPWYQERIRALAGGLEEKKAIPVVNAQMELILEIQTDEFWEYVTLPQLENVRKRLRDLIKFIDKQGGRGNVYTNFEDELGESTEVADLVVKDVNLKNYRLKVERFIREHETHITIHKLKRNQPIAEEDIDALEEILFSADGPGTRDDFSAAYGTEQPLGKLVRQIVGLERNAAKEAFNEFLSSAVYSADQIAFINRIVEHLVHNGLMESKELFAPPFTDMHDQGIAGVLHEDAAKVVEVIERINANAVA